MHDMMFYRVLSSGCEIPVVAKDHKIKSGGIHEEKDATFGLHLKIDNMTNIDFRLDGEVSDEIKGKCIDKVFGLVDSMGPF